MCSMGVGDVSARNRAAHPHPTIHSRGHTWRVYAIGKGYICGQYAMVLTIGAALIKASAVYAARAPTQALKDPRGVLMGEVGTRWER